MCKIEPAPIADASPIKNAHKNSLKLPLNNIVNADVEIPANNNVLIKE